MAGQNDFNVVVDTSTCRLLKMGSPDGAPGAEQIPARYETWLRDNFGQLHELNVSGTLLVFFAMAQCDSSA